MCQLGIVEAVLSNRSLLLQILKCLLQILRTPLQIGDLLTVLLFERGQLLKLASRCIVTGGDGLPPILEISDTLLIDRHVGFSPVELLLPGADLSLELREVLSHGLTAEPLQLLLPIEQALLSLLESIFRLNQLSLQLSELVFQAQAAPRLLVLAASSEQVVGGHHLTFRGYCSTAAALQHLTGLFNVFSQQGGAE